MTLMKRSKILKLKRRAQINTDLFTVSRYPPLDMDRCYILYIFTVHTHIHLCQRSFPSIRFDICTLIYINMIDRFQLVDIFG